MVAFELVFAISIIALAFAAYLAWFVLRQDAGTDKMQAISNAIREGAEAFIKRQYTTIAALSIALAVVIFAGYSLAGQPGRAWYTAASFIFGAFCSALAGIIGMYISVRANIRTAAASRTSSSKAL